MAHQDDTERAETSAELDAAISRLEAGKPNHPDLKIKQIAGKLRINISTVALEAGLSRTLIGHERCSYPAQRARVVGLRGGRPAKGTLLALNAKLRADLVSAKRRERLDASLRAALLRRIYHADKAVSRADRKAMRSKNNSTSGHIGRSIPPSEVVPLLSVKDTGE